MSTDAGLCLSRREIRELTRTPQTARQLAFLRTNGIRHYLDGYGRPVVLRSAVEGLLGTNDGAAGKGWRPNKVA